MIILFREISVLISNGNPPIGLNFKWFNLDSISFAAAAGQLYWTHTQIKGFKYLK